MMVGMPQVMAGGDGAGVGKSRQNEGVGVQAVLISQALDVGFGQRLINLVQILARVSYVDVFRGEGWVIVKHVVPDHPGVGDQ